MQFRQEFSILNIFPKGPNGHQILKINQVENSSNVYSQIKKNGMKSELFCDEETFTNKLLLVNFLILSGLFSLYGKYDLHTLSRIIKLLLYIGRKFNFIMKVSNILN